MADRRSLIEGLNTDETSSNDVETEFVYGNEATKNKPASTESPAPATASAVLPQMTTRVPITTRARPEIATALKRASLQRQLNGETPFYVQEIMEDALAKWLQAHGYLNP